MYEEPKIKVNQSIPISWNDLRTLLALLNNVKDLSDKSYIEKAQKLFNEKVNLNEEEFSFENEEIKEILNVNLPIMKRVYDSYKRISHKSTLEFDKYLGEDIVQLFIRLGR